MLLFALLLYSSVLWGFLLCGLPTCVPLVPSDLERGMSMPALERETFQLALYSHNFPPHADSQNLLEKTFFSGEQKYLNALMRTLNSVSPALTGAMRSCSRTNIFCPITGEKEKKTLIPWQVLYYLVLEIPFIVHHVKQGHPVVDGVDPSS